MSRSVNLQIDSLDYLQIIEAVEAKITAWRFTEQWLRASENGDSMLTDELVGSIEECSDPDEAANVAESYEVILSSLQAQYRAQTSN